MGKKLPVCGWGAPLGALIAMVFGQTEGTMLFMIGWLAAELCTLFAFDALRRAAATAISDEKLGRMMRSALLTLIPAAAFFWGFEKFRDVRMMLMAALIAMLLRCAQAILEAKGDRVSLILTDVLLAIGLSAALLGAPGPRERNFGCLLAAGLPALLALLFILPVWAKGWKLSGAFFKEIPLAMLRNLPWMLLVAGLMDKAPSEGLMLGFVAGCLIMELTRPIFRRRENEGMGQRLGVALAALIAAAIGILAVQCLPDEFLRAWAALPMVFAALGCALLVYGPTQWRVILAGAMLILVPAGVAAAEWMGLKWTPLLTEAAYGLAAILVCGLMIPDIALLHRQIRANQLRKQAHRRVR